MQSSGTPVLLGKELLKQSNLFKQIKQRNINFQKERFSELFSELLIKFLTKINLL